ncbi:hypothetical protein [Streptomyces sp. KLOTTS4A1]|uniref:hypothetical protein n=1 Tax=Streptomyces sp. KLOTTS4A1 TaxID=3390996 RepID=UPI0039F58223
MRSKTKALTAIAAGLLTAGAFAAPASAATAPSGQDAQRTAEVGINQVVTTWTSANVRSCPWLSCRIVYSVGANQGLNARCYTEGQTIDQNGYRHNKWVRLYSGNYIWGGLLKGDQTGGVHNHC